MKGCLALQLLHVSTGHDAIHPSCLHIQALSCCVPVLDHLCLNPTLTPCQHTTKTHLWAVRRAKLLPACAVADGNGDCTLQHTHTAAGQAHPPPCQLPKRGCKAPTLHGYN